MSDKPRIYLENNPTVTRLVPELAAEIGLNESIMLLQIDFWISISNHFEDGRWWTYQSVRDIRKVFKFWGVATINRIITKLEEKQYIVTGNYNKRAGDNTRWIALNPDGLGKLKSIKILFQNGTPLNQNGTVPFQNGTTLPENTPESSTDKKKTTPPKTAAGDNPFFAVICATFGLSPQAGMVGRYAALLAGTAKTGEWRTFRIEPGLTAADVEQFGKWYKKTYPTLSMPSKPDTIQRYVYQWRESLTHQPTPLAVSNPNAEFQARPTLHGGYVKEKQL